ncbi:MAG TPA: outer membrane beta-barrel protein [Gammaproteobacteria bacterium]
MGIRKLLFAGAMLPLAAVAQEQSLDYTYVEATYTSVEEDFGLVDIDGNGFGVKGSLAVSDSVFLFAGYATEDYDDVDVDGTKYDLGAGMRWGLNPRLDLVGELAWMHAEADAGAISADDDGLGLGVGLRSRVHDDIELQGGLRYVDFDDSDTFLSFGGRYYFTDSVAAGFGLDFNDDWTGWNLGIRAEFGN